MVDTPEINRNRTTQIKNRTSKKKQIKSLELKRNTWKKKINHWMGSVLNRGTEMTVIKIECRSIEIIQTEQEWEKIK